MSRVSIILLRNQLSPIFDIDRVGWTNLRFGLMPCLGYFLPDCGVEEKFNVIRWGSSICDSTISPRLQPFLLVYNWLSPLLSTLDFVIRWLTSQLALLWLGFKHLAGMHVLFINFIYLKENDIQITINSIKWHLLYIPKLFISFHWRSKQQHYLLNKIIVSNQCNIIAEK